MSRAVWSCRSCHGPIERLDLVELLGVEVVQAVVVVVVFRAGDELLEGGRAVLRQGEVLDEADVAGPCVRRQKDASPNPTRRAPARNGRTEGMISLRKCGCRATAREPRQSKDDQTIPNDVSDV